MVQNFIGSYRRAWFLNNLVTLFLSGPCYKYSIRCPKTLLCIRCYQFTPVVPTQCYCNLHPWPHCNHVGPYIWTPEYPLTISMLSLVYSNYEAPCITQRWTLFLPEGPGLPTTHGNSAGEAWSAWGGPDYYCSKCSLFCLLCVWLYFSTCYYCDISYA